MIISPKKTWIFHRMLQDSLKMLNLLKQTVMERKFQLNISDLQRTTLKKQRINYLKHLKNILLKIEKNGGYYVISDSNISKSVIDQIRRTIALQESYEIPESVAEQAYKNVASANIYAVSSDIRNRDQAYTAIGMSDPRRAADNSPKGEQTAHLNMLNPFTKYVMQYQNLVGKKDIGIFANAEKFWFNDYYYWTKILKSGNPKAIEYLKYQVTLNRIKDRAKMLLLKVPHGYFLTLI